MTENISPISDEDLRRLASAALDLFPLDERREEDGAYRCPMCDGEGTVDGSVLLSTAAEYCAGVQVFGIGDGHLALEAFFQAANPAAVLSLLNRLAAAEAERDKWKANHDNQVSVRRCFSARPDLPMIEPERMHLMRFIEEIEKQRDAAEAALARLQHWTPEHTIEQWLADVQKRLDAAEAALGDIARGDGLSRFAKEDADLSDAALLMQRRARAHLGAREGGDDVTTCSSCGKAGPDADDFGGQCEMCYNETANDWSGPLYCQSCYHTLKESDLPHEEPVGCPYCRCGLLMPINQMEYNRRTDETRSAWDKAVRDGLIRP